MYALYSTYFLADNLLKHLKSCQFIRNLVSQIIPISCQHEKATSQTGLHFSQSLETKARLMTCFL